MALTGASRFAPVPLRLAIGAACLYHGYQVLFEGPSFRHFIDEVTALGLPQPATLAYVAAWGALAGGVMLLMGFAARLAALVNGATLGVIVWKLHLAGDPAHVVERIRNGFSGPDGYLVPLVLMLVCLSIVLTGAGTLSLDAFLAGRKAAD